MKNLFSYTFLLIVFVVGSFWAGSWYAKRETSKDNPSSLKPSGIDGESESQDPEPQGMVKIGVEKQQVIGIRTALVKMNHTLHTLRVLGRVAVDDRKVYVVNSATAGWVRDVSPVTVGSFVQKDQALAVFYSPEFLAAEQAYFYALNAYDRFAKEEKINISQLAVTKANIQQYGDTLRNLGMGEKQIEEIGRTRTFTDIIHIASPAGGIVISRNIYSGQRFERGTELFKIADLHSVWILVDTFENEEQYLKPGFIVKILHPHLKKTFQAKVSADLPQFDPATRSLKVRLESDNPGYVLRPDMFVDVELLVKLPPAITVPTDALLDSGLRKTVYIDRGKGFFEPREVETGWRIGNQVEIVRGLEVGEKVVTSGTFLVDSESKLELAAQGMYTTLSKDPVCGADVSMRKADKAGLKAAYKGKTFYFDSEECREKFEKEPERYTEK